MTVRLRSIFDEIPTYRPGECPDEEEGDQLIKMSSNELPWGPSEQLKTSLLSAFESINRYPDFYKQNLSIELAKYTNMQPENNLVKNLVYSGSKQNVKLTMVNGKVLYEDGIFLIGFDPAEIYTKANEIIGRMKECR